MSTTPLKVAIIGAGPAGLYAAADLLRHDEQLHVDVIDRLTTPGGLARSGVSPDHAQRREVVTVLERLVMASGRFRFIGNLRFGEDVQLAELQQHYGATLFASGAGQDRSLGVPGEDLPGSHAATAFVGWYNAHPDYAQHRFDLTHERAVVIGNGNVALDVARMLLLPVAALGKTDIADHALSALAHSAIREVVILGRRGPAQASFTAPELLELASLQDVDVHVDGDIPAADASTSPGVALRLQLLRELQQRPSTGAPRRLVLQFFRAPVAILGDTQVSGVQVAKTRVVADAQGQLRAEATGETDTLNAGLVFRSVGYRSEPLPGLPFDAQRCILPNAQGRVLDTICGTPLPGLYVTGWLKRGPSGVIGSNRFCARDTVQALLDDRVALQAAAPVGGADLLDALRIKGKHPTDYAGWKRIDRAERQRGADSGRSRQRYADSEALLQLAQPAA